MFTSIVKILLYICPLLIKRAVIYALWNFQKGRFRLCIRRCCRIIAISSWGKSISGLRLSAPAGILINRYAVAIIRSRSLLLCRSLLIVTIVLRSRWRLRYVLLWTRCLSRRLIVLLVRIFAQEFDFANHNSCARNFTPSRLVYSSVVSSPSA